MSLLAETVEIILSVIGALFLLLLLVEVLPNYLRHHRLEKKKSQKVDLDERTQADCFKSVDWGPQYFSEYWSAVRNVEWRSYVYFRCRAFRGKFINIDDRGLRKTWNPEPSGSGETPLKIFFFGGSTGWGLGARDEHTIPSELSKVLQETDKRPIEVTNFAENGYVSTQSMLTLMLELRKGNTPDLVVFYDGINDAFSAYQNGVAGLPQNEINRRQEFNLLNPFNRPTFYKHAAEILLRRTLRFLGKSNLVPREKTKRAEVGKLTAEIVDTYAQVVKTITLLGQEHGFKSCFFWQPSIYTKKHLSVFEKSEKDINQKYADLIVGSAEKLAHHDELSACPTFWDLSHILDDHDEGIFLDFVHISEQGNQLVAQAMAPLVAKSLKHQASQTN